MILAKNINFSYPKSKDVFSTDVSFEIRAGDRVKIEGSPGSGVSTLLRLLVGSLSVTRGTLSIAVNTVGVLDPISLLRPEFSVKDNIHLFCSFYSISSRVVWHKVSEFLDEYNIPSGRHALRQLSSSQKKALAVVLLMQLKGEVLIVDYWANVKAYPTLHGLLWQGLHAEFETIVTTSSAPKTFVPNLIIDLD